MMNLASPSFKAANLSPRKQRHTADAAPNSSLYLVLSSLYILERATIDAPLNSFPSNVEVSSDC